MTLSGSDWLDEQLLLPKKAPVSSNRELWSKGRNEAAHTMGQAN